MKDQPTSTPEDLTPPRAVPLPAPFSPAEGSFPQRGETVLTPSGPIPTVPIPNGPVPNGPVPPATDSQPPENGPSGFKVIVRGFSWVTASQVVTAGGNLVLTPFVIHGLGIERYGLFALAGTITAFLSTLNGGLGATAYRYFPIYAGTDDKVGTTRLLVTFLLFVLIGGTILTVVDWFVAPVIVNALSMSPALRPESVFLFRTLGILVTFGLAHQLVQAVIVARQRFDRVVQAGFLCYLLWVGGLVWVVNHHEGLRGVAIVFVLQQAATVAVIAPSAMRYLTRKGLSLLPLKQVRELLSFSVKLQVNGMASLMNGELDTLVVGGALSVRTVGIYNVGTNLATQLATVASNAFSPAAVQLGNTFGKYGEERTFEQFTRMQRSWVMAMTGWVAVGMGAAYFGVTAWLGPEFRLGGWVAIVAVASVAPALCGGITNIYVTVMRRAGLEMRYGLVMMVVNIIVMVPLVLVGAVAVAAASGLAQLAGAVYLLRTARRQIRPDLPNFFRQMPLLRAAVAGVVTAAFEFLVRPYIHTGAVGLLECIPPALAGLVVYGLLVVGPNRAMSFAISVFRNRRLPQDL